MPLTISAAKMKQFWNHAQSFGRRRMDRRLAGDVMGPMRH